MARSANSYRSARRTASMRDMHPDKFRHVLDRATMRGLARSHSRRSVGRWGDISEAVLVRVFKREEAAQRVYQAARKKAKA